MQSAFLLSLALQALTPIAALSSAETILERRIESPQRNVFLAGSSGGLDGGTPIDPGHVAQGVGSLNPPSTPGDSAKGSGFGATIPNTSGADAHRAAAANSQSYAAADGAAAAAARGSAANSVSSIEDARSQAAQAAESHAMMLREQALERAASARIAAQAAAMQAVNHDHALQMSAENAARAAAAGAVYQAAQRQAASEAAARQAAMLGAAHQRAQAQSAEEDARAAARARAANRYTDDADDYDDDEALGPEDEDDADLADELGLPSYAIESSIPQTSPPSASSAAPSTSPSLVAPVSQFVPPPKAQELHLAPGKAQNYKEDPKSIQTNTSGLCSQYTPAKETSPNACTFVRTLFNTADIERDQMFLKSTSWSETFKHSDDGANNVGAACLLSIDPCVGKSGDCDAGLNGGQISDATFTLMDATAKKKSFCGSMKVTYGKNGEYTAMVSMNVVDGSYQIPLGAAPRPDYHLS